MNTESESFACVTPWLISRSSVDLMQFLKNAFDAVETPHSRIQNSDGQIIHAVMKIGNATVLLFDSRKGWAPTPNFLNLYVNHIDKVHQKALEFGAESVTEITSLWFGEKVCRILDPFGNLWWINQRVKAVDLTNLEEVKRLSTTQEAVSGITYIQKSLDEAMKIQKAFFE